MVERSGQGRVRDEAEAALVWVVAWQPYLTYQAAPREVLLEKRDQGW